MFGGLAFTATPRKELDKFKARGLPYVFLGYLVTQKGYKLLNLQSSKIFVSRDVKFEEHIIPFHNNSAAAYMQPTLINMVPRTQANDINITLSPHASQMPKHEPTCNAEAVNPSITISDVPTGDVAAFANIDHDTDDADYINANHDHNSRTPRTVKRLA